MKNTIIITPNLTFIAVCFLLLNENTAVAASLDANRIILPEVSIVLAESAVPVSDRSNKTTHGTQMPKANPDKRKPLEPAIQNALRELVNTSHEGLVEEKTSKGVEMKLKGRFRTAPVATIEEDGAITVRDYTSAPPAE